jgi:hypothetical protein
MRQWPHPYAQSMLVETRSCEMPMGTGELKVMEVMYVLRAYAPNSLASLTVVPGWNRVCTRLFVGPLAVATFIVMKWMPGSFPKVSTTVEKEVMPVGKVSVRVVAPPPVVFTVE